MLLTRKKENLSTGLHIWVSPLAQPGDVMASLRISATDHYLFNLLCTWEFIVLIPLSVFVDLLGRIECLEVLFKAGAEINSKDKKV